MSEDTSKKSIGWTGRAYGKATALKKEREQFNRELYNQPVVRQCDFCYTDGQRCQQLASHRLNNTIESVHLCHEHYLIIPR